MRNFDLGDVRVPCNQCSPKWKSFFAKMDPNGEVALVTGGARGIGYSCCREFLRKGCNVVMFDINAIEGETAQKKLAAEFGGKRVIYIRGDVTRAEQLEGAFKWAIDTFQRLDIVFNNAAIFDENRVEKVISVNLSAVVRGTMLAMKYMGRDRGGNGGIVINMSSLLGVQPYAGCPIYCATKQALVGLSRSFGEPFYYNTTGVRVVALCPGMTGTDMMYCDAVVQMFEKHEKLTMENIPKQMSVCVAEAVIKLVNQASSGSVWVVENGEPAYEIKIADYSAYRKID